MWEIRAHFKTVMPAKAGIQSTMDPPIKSEDDKRGNGQSLIELIVVIAVVSIVVGALVFATIGSIRNASFAKNQAQATKLAQEGLERVRSGRDRNSAISIGGTSVTFWNGSSSSSLCSGTSDIKSDSIWCYKISGSGLCEDGSLKCYFNVDSNGNLANKGFAQNSIPSLAESIPPFTRVITLSDDSDYQNTKTVTTIVTWKDFSGSHESRLTTILRKI